VSESLRNALANAISVLPTGVKNDLGVHFLATREGLRVSGSDGYTFVTQLVSVDVVPGTEVHVPKTVLKTLPKDFELPDLMALLESDGCPPASHTFTTLINMATDPLGGEARTEFSWAPDRVKKIGMLKPAGLPIQCVHDSNEHVDYVRFTYGDVQGVFTLLEDS